MSASLCVISAFLFVAAGRPAASTAPATRPTLQLRVVRFTPTLPNTPAGKPPARLSMSRAGRIDYQLVVETARPPDRLAAGPLEAECRTSRDRTITTARSTLRLYPGVRRDVHQGRWELPRGAWPPGPVEVQWRFRGRPIGRSRFEIVDDRDRRAQLASPIVDAHVRLFVLGADKQRTYPVPPKFPMTTTSVIGWDLEFRNNLYMWMDSHEWITVRWTGPDNGVLAVQRRKADLPKTGFEVRLWSEYGYDEPGRWYPGAYRLTFQAEDKTVAETTFQIIDDRDPNTIRQHPVTVERVRFFEPAPEGAKRRYTDRFAMSSTTMIGWELALRHNQFARARTVGFLDAKWYGPYPNRAAATQPHPKKVPAQSVSEKSLEPSETSGESPRWIQRTSLLLKVRDAVATHRADWGFRQPGCWLPGAYRVDFVFRGRTLAHGVVQVIDDRDDAALEAEGMKLVSFTFGQDSAPEKPVTAAAADRTSHLVWRLTGRNCLYGVRDAKQTFELRWFTQDGLLLAERQHTVSIAHDQWLFTCQGRVADVLGANPIADVYRVEVWFRDRLLDRAKLRLTVGRAGSAGGGAADETSR